MFELPKSQQDLGYILGGAALSILLFLLGPAFSPFLAALSSFVQLPLLCLGLGRGVSAQFYASLLTLVSIAFLAGLQNSLALLFVNLAPAMLLAYLALLCRRDPEGTLFWYPPGRLIAALTAYGLGVLGLFSVFLSRGDYGAVFHTELIQTAPDHLRAQYTQWVDQLIKFLPCIITVGAMLTTLFNAMAAQAILVKYQKNRRPTPAVSAIELPWWLWVALAVCGVAALVFRDAQRQFFMNAVPVLLFAFLFEGLGIVHALLARYSPGKMFVWIFYMTMILFGWPILIVIVLGLFDPWIKLRERLTPS
ncbi:MAG: DUF2232 domain-containing protein [Caedimonas sp.]|nr:DUF2232 domain-containing protein [Caedimonas sp.]